MDDYFTYSLFLNYDEKIKLSNAISKHIFNVLNDVKDHGIIANVYLSGSLARREPSVIYRNGHYHLNSDIDFIIILDSEFNNDENWLMNITDYLNRKYPSYKDSVIIAPKEKMNHFISCIGKDFELGLNNPLYESFPIIKETVTRVTKDDLFDCIVHQFTCYYLNSAFLEGHKDIFNKDINYSYIKMLLECLRIQLYDTGYEYIRYYNIYSNAESLGKLLGVNSHDIIGLLKARELFGKEKIPSIKLFDFLVYTICRLFELSDNAEEENLIDHLLFFLVNRARLGESFLKKYQCCVAMFALACEANDKYKTTFIDNCFLTLNSISSFLAEETYFANFKNMELSEKLFQTRQLLSSLRKKYLDELTIKDTGNSGFSDINKTET